MSDAAGSHSDEFVVDDELLRQLKNRGVHTTAHSGDVVRLQLVHGRTTEQGDPFADFIGSFSAGEDFSSKVDEILENGFGQS